MNLVRLLFVCFVCLGDLASAQDAKPPGPGRDERRVFELRDFEVLHFDASFGVITFKVAGRWYRYEPASARDTAYAAKVSAAAAVMSELRQASKIIISLSIPSDATAPISVKSLMLEYEVHK